MLADILKSSEVSLYQPSKEVADFTAVVKKSYGLGQEILTRPWPELNNRSVIDDENHGQRMFNAFVDDTVEDPATAWQYRGTRSNARNKGIAMHAQLTAAYLIPIFVAQNEDDETDQAFSDFMRDIVEWMTFPENSDYQTSFMNVVFGMLSNPVTYMGAEYCEVMQTIKDKKANGEISTKEVVDQVLSGFRAPVYSANQVLITNAYERNIQKQTSIIKRRYVDKAELKAEYGDHENWGAVQSGVKSIYNEQDGMFYDIFDEDHKDLVEEVTYLNRREDTEVCFLNGVYVGESNVENNPIYHRDNHNAPKYDVVPFGYYRIGQHFFYYKSMMNTMRWDNNLYDAMNEIIMNRALLEQNMPIAISGEDKIDTDVVFPGAQIASANPNFKVTPILPTANFVAGFQAMREIESSMEDASLSDVQTGQLPEASQKAYSVAQAAQAAKKIIGGVGKSLAESVTMYGDLMKDIAIQHITVPQADETVGKGTRLKYRSFLIPKKNVGSKTVDKQIRFSADILGQEMTEEEQNNKDFELLSEVKYPDNKQHLYIINPEVFAKFNYYSKVDLKEMFPMNEEVQGALWQGLYPLLKDDPYITQDDLRRKLLRPYGAEELVQKEPQMLPGMVPPEQSGQIPGQTPVASQALNKGATNALSGMV